MIIYENNDRFYMYDSDLNKVYVSEDSKIKEKYFYNFDNNIGEIKEEYCSRCASNFSNISIVYIMTPYCNLRCKYCYENSKCETKVFTLQKLIDTYLAFVSTYPQKNISISFFGGEPLIEIEKIISFVNYVEEYCQRNNLKIPTYKIITNGTLIDDNIAEFLCNKMDAITVSLDGQEDIHNENRVYMNGNGSFSAAYEGIKKIKKYNKRNIIVACEVTVTDAYLKYYKEDTIKEFFNLLEELEIKIVAFMPVMGNHNIEQSKFEIVARDIVNAWFQRIEEGKKYIEVPNLRSFMLMLLGKKTCEMLTCSAGNAYFAITANDKIYACQTEVFANNDKSIGIIENGKIKLSKKPDNKKVKYLSKKCKECECFRGCNIYCKAMHADNNNEMMFSCEFNKMILKYMIINYVDYFKLGSNKEFYENLRSAIF